MADIPQEARDSLGGTVSSRVVGPMTDHERFITAVAYDSGYQAGLKAGKRAGMERAAEIADEWCADCSSIETNWDDGYYQASAGLAQAIRSENDGHG